MKDKSELIVALADELPEEFVNYNFQEHYKKCFAEDCKELAIRELLNRFTVAWLNYYYHREHIFDYRKEEEKRIKEINKIFRRCLFDY